jgi:hypothetical protein
MGGAWHTTEADAIAAWNRRAPSAGSEACLRLAELVTHWRADERNFADPAADMAIAIKHTCAAELRQLAPALQAAMQGEPFGRYFADGPQGWFVTDDLNLARALVNAYDKDEDWTITDTANPTGHTPPTAAEPGEA